MKSTVVMRENLEEMSRIGLDVPVLLGGAALTLPGLSKRFEPHPYQRDAVARIIAEPNVLLDHVVGAGKSGTMFMAAMELRRLGLARQPWIVVPNHIIEQVGKEAKWWYPSAEILLGAPGTDPEGRRRFVAQSATSDWDMVIVPQSLFEAIPVGPEVQRDYIERELEILREALSATLFIDSARALSKLSPTDSMDGRMPLGGEVFGERDRRIPIPHRCDESDPPKTLHQNASERRQHD